MQPYRTTTETTDLLEHSAKRGLMGMNPEYVGANYLDSGAFSKLGTNHQADTRAFYNIQDQGKNYETRTNQETANAARQADREIQGAAGKAQVANQQLNNYKANLIESTGMKNSALRNIANPEVENKTKQDLAVINEQGRAIRQNQMFA